MLKKLFRQLKLAKLIFIFGFLASALFITCSSVFAQEKPTFVNIVNPVRGEEFWQKSTSPLESTAKQYEFVKKNNLAASWLLRFDAISDPEIVKFFKNIDKNQELGIFMEVTPSLTQAAGVSYNQSQSWHFAESVFLAGYTQEAREKLIGAAFKKFKTEFGYYPKSVGAWWIDSYSLSHMSKNYGIVANLDVADQFSTDNYQVWGQYFGVPFYPSKKDASVPTKSPEAAISIVTIQWALRDPLNGYGPGVQESTYSLQPNDYLLYHNLNIDYFKKLFDIYAYHSPNKFGQITLGLENDVGGDKFFVEQQRQLEFILEKQKQGQLQVVTMSQFADWYKNQFPHTSGPHLIFAEDPLGSDAKVVWYMTTNYRIGWFYNGKEVAVRDLRLYNDSSIEPCYAVSCKRIDLAITVSKALDDVTYNQRWVLDEGKISNFSLTAVEGGVAISYQNQAGKVREIRFLANDLVIDGKPKTIAGAIIDFFTSEEGKKDIGIPEPFAKPGEFSVNLAKFLLNSVIFTVFAIFAFLIPGWLLLNFLKLKFSFLELLTLAFLVGLVLFTLASFILGFLHLRFLIFWVLIAIFFYTFLFRRPRLAIPKITVKHFLVFFILIIGVFTQVLPVVKSGWIYDYGLGFWGPNGHDGIWHLSIISELKNHFPPQNPDFAGVPLKNYHYFSDLTIAQTAKMTGISILDLYFRFFPTLVSLLFGLSVFILVRQITKSETASLLAVFLSYFGGGFGWIVSLLKEGRIGGESMFWATGSVSFLLNPPFAFSIIFLLAGLFFFWHYLREKRTSLTWPLVVLWGPVIQFKAYAGILILVSLAVLVLYEVIFRKSFSFLKLLVLIVAVSALVFLPIFSKTNSLFSFAPFWFIHTMVDYQDRFYWVRLSNARVAYIQMGWWWKFILAEILGFLIFFFGNLGIRFLALGTLLSWIRSKFKISFFWLFVATIFISGLLIPLIFIQKGTPWNTIQFFYYSAYLANILAAVFFWQMIKNRSGWIQFVAIAVFCVITIPTTLGTLYYHYLPNRPPARLSFGELEALEFLKVQPQGTVLSRAYDEKLRDKFDLPLPLFVYQTSAYISAFSEKREFVADEVTLGTIAVPYEDRVVGQKEFFRTRDENFARNFLRKNNINYIYVTKFERWDPAEKNLGIKKIFENGEVKIYKVIYGV